MGHFMLDAGGVELNLYCRDQETFERLVETAGEEGAVTQVLAEVERDTDPRRLHLYLKGSRVAAVNHEGSAHRGRSCLLPANAVAALTSALPFIKVPKSRRVPAAPFGAGMLPALTDF